MVTKKDLLIVGSKSGLGKFLHENIPSIEFSRNTPIKEFNRLQREGVNTIIHCAYNSKKEVKLSDFTEYISDNVLLTNKITKIPNSKFIYISTVDVYPKDRTLHSEEEDIFIDRIKNIYPITKIMSESIVRKNCKNPLILRCSGLLGENIKINTLVKLFNGLPLTLSSNSIFNYISHTDVLDFIKIGLKRDLFGVYNLSSSKNETLQEIANNLKLKPQFGDYFYDVGKIDNTKAKAILPSLKKSTSEVIKKFIGNNKI